MLLEFSVGNYLSFREDATLSLVATRLKARDQRLNEGSQTDVGGVRTLHGAVLYGANASGKSNLLRAMTFFFRFVRDSAREGQSGDEIPVQPFAFHEDSVEEPSYFEVVFVLEGVRYRYGAELDRTRVCREWLYRRKAREVLLFSRDEHELVVKPSFSRSALAKEPPRDNALYLSVAAQRNLPEATALMTWFNRAGFISGIGRIGHGYTYTAHQLVSERLGSALLDFVLAMDLGIRDIQVEEQSLRHDDLPKDLPDEIIEKLVGTKDLRVTSVHPIYDDDGTEVGVRRMDFQSESEGTRKLFALAGLLFDTLDEGGLIVIDEFDARLHPMIACEVVRLFQRRETNPKGAQLIIATHDTNLLKRELFRRDQVWFLEKRRRGSSDLYPLASFKVRNDASFEADYIAGRYGAIPFLGGLEGVVRLATDEHGETP